MLRACILLLTLLGGYAQTNGTSRVWVQYGDVSLVLNETTIGSQPTVTLPDSVVDTIPLPALGLDIYIVEGDPNEACAELLDTIPGISSCEADVTISLDAGSASPDDPLYAQQSQFQLSNYPAAWAAGYFGASGIKACVVDTGIALEHPDIQDNLWTNPSPMFGDAHGADFSTGTAGGDVEDANGHG